MIKIFKTRSLILMTLISLSCLSVFGQKSEVLELNKRPLIDFAQVLNENLQEKEVNLKAPFSVTLEGELDENCRFDVKKSKFIKSEGDAKMVEVVKNAMQAVNDSGVFGYFQNLKSNKLSWTLAQDETQLVSIMQSAQADENKAKTFASSYKLLISTAKLLHKDKDEEILLNYLTVTSQGNNVIFNMTMPKDEAQEMLQRKLTEVNQQKSAGNSK